jgi:hypothetical protein
MNPVIEVTGGHCITQTKHAEMRKFIATRLHSLLVLFFALSLSVSQLQGQTTLTTLPNPPYNGGNSLTGPSQVSFVIDNTNGFPILLSAISNWCTTTENNAIWQLYCNPPAKYIFPDSARVHSLAAKKLWEKIYHRRAGSSAAELRYWNLSASKN